MKYIHVFHPTGCAENAHSKLFISMDGVYAEAMSGTLPALAILVNP